jgi:hypothetical protein
MDHRRHRPLGIAQPIQQRLQAPQGQIDRLGVQGLQAGENGVR